MPSCQEHLDKARLNESFSKHFDLNKTPYKDWAVLGAFYSALHYVEAYLAKHGIHPINHGERYKCITRDAKLKPIWRSYRDLKHLRDLAAYDVKSFSSTEIQNDVFLALVGVKLTIESLGITVN